MSRKPFVFGVAAGLGLLAVYFAILSLVNSPVHALQQFSEIWYFMVPLVAGFGVQVGLFSAMREAAKVSAAAATVSGSVSSGSMIACCAHHVADVVPILGFSAAAAVLNAYQPLLLSVGIFSNIIGILYMLNMMKKHSLFAGSPVIGNILKLNTSLILEVSFVVGLAALLAIGISLSGVFP